MVTFLLLRSTVFPSLASSYSFFSIDFQCRIHWRDLIVCAFEVFNPLLSLLLHSDGLSDVLSVSPLKYPAYPLSFPVTVLSHKSYRGLSEDRIPLLHAPDKQEAPLSHQDQGCLYDQSFLTGNLTQNGTTSWDVYPFSLYTFIIPFILSLPVLFFSSNCFFDQCCQIIDDIMDGTFHRHSGCTDMTATTEIFCNAAYIDLFFRPETYLKGL